MALVAPNFGPMLDLESRAGEPDAAADSSATVPGFARHVRTLEAGDGGGIAPLIVE